MPLTLSVSEGISLSLGRYLTGTSSGFFGFFITFVSPPIETLLSFFEFESSLDDWWEQGRLVNRIRTAKRLTRTDDERLENIWSVFAIVLLSKCHFCSTKFISGFFYLFTIFFNILEIYGLRCYLLRSMFV
jgi:hypothetical protein